MSNLPKVPRNVRAEAKPRPCDAKSSVFLPTPQLCLVFTHGLSFPVSPITHPICLVTGRALEMGICLEKYYFTDANTNRKGFLEEEYFP